MIFWINKNIWLHEYQQNNSLHLKKSFPQCEVCEKFYEILKKLKIQLFNLRSWKYDRTQ